jgi:hypothetical protein
MLVGSAARIATRPAFGLPMEKLKSKGKPAHWVFCSRLHCTTVTYSRPNALAMPFQPLLRDLDT